MAGRVLPPSVALMALFAVACGREPDPTATTPSAGGSVGWEVLPLRAQVVAEADRLAVEAAGVNTPAQRALALRAASLRERIWRIEHREADLLEAIELNRQAAHGAGEEGCRAELRAALLEASKSGAMDAFYLALEAARLQSKSSGCSAAAERALKVLAAHRPSDQRMSALRAEDGDGAAALSGARATVVPPDSSTLKGPTEISKLERYGANAAARVVVFLTNPAVFSVGSLPASAGQPPRFFVDIDQASYKGQQRFSMQGLVRGLRLGRRGDGTRVVLDLERAVHHRVFYLPEPFRLVIDVSAEAPRSFGDKGGPRQVSRVVLDPGHGGHDPGAVGPSGLREKDVTLDVAHRAAPLLARELKVATLLTRDTDDFVPLDERSARANAFNADLFISIHCNASEDSHSRGIMTFVLDASPDFVSAQVAARENAASPAAAAELANVMSKAIDQDSLTLSTRFADLLQRATVASLKPKYPSVRDHGVKRAGFYVLAGARMPAVLYETSFISHEREELLLNNSEYRQKLADALVNAVRAYRQGL